MFKRWWIYLLPVLLLPNLICFDGTSSNKSVGVHGYHYFSDSLDKLCKCQIK